MTCGEVKNNLSLYLYGELDFAAEEAFEEHLNGCGECQAALIHEKQWHGTVNFGRIDIPLPLLASCRNDLAKVLPAVQPVPASPEWSSPFGFLTRWLPSPSRWSFQLAAASCLVFVGFGAARLMDRLGTGDINTDQTAQMSLLDPANAHVRDIQPGDGNRVRIVYDQMRQREITGQVDDAGIRRLLLAAAKDPADPGVRVNSVEVLMGQSGDDVRDALLYAVQHDPNAGVRVKAMEGLRPFANEQGTREGLTFVLEHDDNMSVRSQAINLLVPATEGQRLSPQLIGTLQELVQADQEDDYVRLRCLQVLRAIQAPVDVY